MTFDDFKTKLDDRIKKDKGDSFLAQCPGHDDKTASLSVSKGKDGRTLIKCFAGCEPARILSPLGLKVSDLFSNGSASNGHPPADPVVARYDYRDANGKVIFQVERRQSKKFAQRRPDPGNPGHWLYNLKGVKRVLYRLPELLNSEPDQWVLLTEGEKDADNLHKYGYVATTNAGGAGKWQDGYSQSLDGRKVCVLPDNDEPGRNHALLVGDKLADIADDLRVLDLPGLPDKGDVSDWLGAGNDPAALTDLVETAPTFAAWRAQQSQADAAPAEQPTGDGIHCTDLGNARRLVDLHGKDLHYVHSWGKWFIWDGSRWVEDETGEIERRAKRTVATIYAEAAGASSDGERKELGKWAFSSEAKKRIDAMIALAKSEPGIPIKHDELDADPWLLNCRNGTIDLRTGKLSPHSRSHLCTKKIDVDYDPSAQCPRWEKFLSEIMDGDQEMVSFLQRADGYSLTGNVSEQCLFFAFGAGENGKSTYLETKLALLGEYAQKAPTEMIMLKSNTGAVPNDVARLVGKRFVVTAEIEGDRRLAESLVKDLTGGDKLVARFMRQEYFEFDPTHKLWLYGNHKPIIRGTDRGIWRRIHLIPFLVQFTGDKKDRGLPAVLRSEMAGILAWMVRGCSDWQNSGLQPPAKVTAATDSYRSEMDVIAAFIEECCYVDKNAVVDFSRLYDAYRQWCERYHERYERNRQFGNALTERGFTPEKGTGNRAQRRGIGLFDFDVEAKGRGDE